MTNNKSNQISPSSTNLEQMGWLAEYKEETDLSVGYIVRQGLKLLADMIEEGMPVIPYNPKSKVGRIAGVLLDDDQFALVDKLAVQWGSKAVVIRTAVKLYQEEQKGELAYG